MAQLAEDVTDAVPAGPSNSQIVRPDVSSIGTGSAILMVRIQLYFHGRSDVAQDYRRFVAFIRRQLGNLEGDWEFEGDERPQLENPEEDFPMVQACARYRHGRIVNVKNAILNFQNQIQLERVPSFPGDGSTPVLLHCQEMTSSGGFSLVTGKLSLNFPCLGWNQPICPADPSTMGDALADVAYNLGGAVMLVDSAYKVANRFWNLITNDPPSSTQASSRPSSSKTGAPSSQPSPHGQGDESCGAFLDRVSSFLDPSWKQGRMRALVQCRQNLAETSGGLEEAFLYANNCALALLSEELSDVSVAGVIPLAHVLETMFDSMKTTIDRAYELTSLHSVEYTKPKRNLNGLVAVGGCALAVGIALTFPWGGPILWAWGAGFAGSQGAVAGGVAAAGAMTSGLCGYQSIINHVQCSRREKMEDAYTSLNRAKYRLLVVMVYLLLGNNPRAASFRQVLCMKLRVKVTDVEDVINEQPRSSDHGEYRKKRLKEAWKEFEEYFELFQESLAEMSK